MRKKQVCRRFSEEPIKEYELTTVTYGTAPTPFLATRCMQICLGGNGKISQGI
jgi:hypothetical protein